MELFSLTAAATQGEPWRLWTGHLVHYGIGHLTLNVLALLPPVLLLRTRSRSALLAQLILIAPILSLLLLFIGGFDELRGASGLVVGAWCIAALMLIREGRWSVGLILFGLVVMKLFVEREHPAILGSDPFIVATAAHAGGAMLASVFAAAVMVLPIHERMTFRHRFSGTIAPLRIPRSEES